MTGNNVKNPQDNRYKSFTIYNIYPEFPFHSLRQLFNGEFDVFLLLVAREYSDEVAATAAKRGLDVSDSAGLLKAADEFIAAFAENGTGNTIWQRIAAALRRYGDPNTADQENQLKDGKFLMLMVSWNGRG